MSRKYYYSILINLMLPLGGMSTDVYLPSLPAMGLHFGVTKALTQLTVTAFVIAMGCSQMIAGPISDALGRKQIVTMALLIQIIAVLSILFSPTIYWIIGFRFIQGCGTAFMMVPGRAIISDIFTGPELQKQINYYTISFALSPIIAPYIGGYLQQYLGWQANFSFILIYALAMLFMLTIFYKETHTNTHPLQPRRMLTNYQRILGNQYFLQNAIFVAFTMGYLALFSVAGPFLIQASLHKSAVFYGRIALLIGIAWFAGNTLNRILFRVDNKLKTQMALWLVLLIAVVFILFAHFNIFNIISLVFPTFLLILLTGFVFPIYISACIVIFTDLGASANGCLFAITWLIFGGYTILAALLKAHSMMPLAITYIGVSLLCLLYYYLIIARLKPNNALAKDNKINTR